MRTILLYATRRIFGAAVLAACVSAGSMAQTSLPVVRTQVYPNFGALTIRVAVANGLCEKRGIKCEVRVVPFAPVALQMLLAGDLDVQNGPAAVAIQAWIKGAKVKLIGNSLREDATYLMASTRVPIDAGQTYPEVMKSLKGRKIGVPARGTGGEFDLVTMLKRAGMDPTDVTIVPVGGIDAALPAIVNGQVDALSHYDPMGTICEFMKVCRIIVDPRKNAGPPEISAANGAYAAYTVSEDFATRNPEVLKAYIAAMKEAAEWIDNPSNLDPLMKIIYGFFRLSLPDGDKILEQSVGEQIGRGAYGWNIDPKALQAVGNYMFDTGQIPNAVDTRSLLLE